MDFLDENEHPPELINKDKIKDMHFSENLRTTSTDMMVEAVANQSKLIPEGKRWHFQKNVEYEEPHLNQHLYDMSSESEHQNIHESTKLDDFIDDDQQQLPSQQSQQQLPQMQQPVAPELSQEEMMLRKLDMLRKLGELAQNGIKLSQNYNMNSDYQTMKFEYDLHYSIRSKKNSINWMTNMMMNCVYGIEMLNDRYNPFEFKLKGWSEQMNSDIGNYYDVFGELYEKYNKPGKSVAPEMKLLFMISGSAIKFHLSNKLLGSLPNLTNMLSSNSNLTQQLRNLTVQEKIKEQNTKANQIIENKVNLEHDKAKQMAEDINFLKQKELEYLKREQEQLKSNSILEQLIKQQQQQQKPQQNQPQMKMPSRSQKTQETDQEISDRLQHKFGMDKSDKSDVKTEVHRDLSKISQLASSILNKNTFNDQSESMMSSESNNSPVTDKNVIDYEDLKSSLSFGTKKGKKRVFNIKSK
jgi:hypothetical protein